MSALDTVTALYNDAKTALFNKIIDLAVNTMTGTTAQFNTALSDNDFATLAGAEVLTHKDLTGASNTFPTLNQNTTGNAATATSATSAATATSAASATTAAALTNGGALNTPVSGVATNLTGVIPDSELAVGENTMTRLLDSTSTNTLTNGLLRLTFFTARKTETITQVRTRTGAQAQVGATLCRIGIYTVDASDNLTALVASTTNDTALWSAGSTTYTKALTASFTKTRGQRYAVGLLEVGSSTAANAFGTVGPEANEAAQVPRLSGTVSSLSDLPSAGSPVVAVGSLAASNILMYAALLP